MDSPYLEQVSKILERVTRRSNNPADLTETLKILADSVLEAVSADICVLFPFKPIGNASLPPLLHRPIVSGQLNNRLHKELRDPKSNGLVYKTLRAGELVLVKNYKQDPDYHSNDFIKQEDLQAVASVPLYTSNHKRPLGLLHLHYRSVQTWSSERQYFLRSIAAYTSLKLENVWLRYRDQEVTRIGQAINANLITVEHLFKTLNKEIGSILDATPFLMLAVYQQQTHKLNVYTAEAGKETIFINDPVEGYSAWVIEKKQKLVVNHFSKEPAVAPVEPVKIVGTLEKQESLIMIPLILRDVVLGVLSIQHPDPYAYDPDDLQTVQLLGNQIAMALSNLQRFGTLNKLHRVGNYLMQGLDSSRSIGRLINVFLKIAEADIVSLYLYNDQPSEFVLSLYTAGELLISDYPKFQVVQPNDVLALAIKRSEPLFSEDSSQLYAIVGGDKSQEDMFIQHEQIRSSALLPLWVGAESIGVLFVNFRDVQSFSETQKQLLQGLSTYAAVAIRNARRFDGIVQRRVKGSDILERIDYEIRKSIELKIVLNTILDQTSQFFNRVEASISLHDEEANELVISAVIGRYKEEKLHRKIPIDGDQSRVAGNTSGVHSVLKGKNPLRWVFWNKQPLLINNIRTQTDWISQSKLWADDISAELNVPLLGDDKECVGIITFESTKENAFTEEDQHFLMIVAGKAAVAIKHAQLYAEAKRLRKESKVLRAVDQMIIKELDSKKVFERILAGALQLTGAKIGSLRTIDYSKKELVLEAYTAEVAFDEQSKRIPLGAGITGRCAESGRPKIVKDTAVDKRYVVFFRQMRSEIAVPLLDGKKVIGVISLESSKVGNFDMGDQRILENLANQAVIAIQNAKSYSAEQKAREQLEVLYATMQQIINASLDDERILNIVTEVGMHRTGAFIANARLWNPGTKELTDAQRLGERYPQEISTIQINTQSANIWVVKNKKTCLISDVYNPPKNVPYLFSHPEMQSELIVPILFEDKILGTLDFGYRETVDFDADEVKLIQSLADQAALAIHRAREIVAQQDMEQRVLEAEVMSSLGEEAYRLAHRLGNDLGLIKSYINLITQALGGKDQLDETVDKYLGKIKRDVMNVLDMSKQLGRDLVDFDPNRSKDKKDNRIHILVKEIIDQAVSAANLPQTVQLKYDIPEGLMLKVNAAQVTEIIRELCVNACKAMSQTGIITIIAQPEQDQVVIKIADSGPGIKPERVTRIFELAYTTKQDGSGFGLWKARRLALANGGDLELDIIDPAQNGAVFLLTLPSTSSKNATLGQREVN